MLSILNEALLKFFFSSYKKSQNFVRLHQIIEFSHITEINKIVKQNKFL